MQRVGRVLGISNMPLHIHKCVALFMRKCGI